MNPKALAQWIRNAWDARDRDAMERALEQVEQLLVPPARTSVGFSLPPPPKADDER